MHAEVAQTPLLGAVVVREIVPVDVLTLGRARHEGVRRFESRSALELSDMQGFLDIEPSPDRDIRMCQALMWAPLQLGAQGTTRGSRRSGFGNYGVSVAVREYKWRVREGLV